MTIFAKKIAVVTGASRGIGKAIALELADGGARVACLATQAENAAAVVAEIQSKGGDARALGCRVEIGAEVTQAFARIKEEFGTVDILVNNAGVTYPQFTLDMTEENWDLHMNVNAKSIFLCSQAAARQMKAHGGGCIINIGSILGRNAFPATLVVCPLEHEGLSLRAQRSNLRGGGPVHEIASSLRASP
jgi:3-oxoacyl-[acyl-carrier protein] reductase